MTPNYWKVTAGQILIIEKWPGGHFSTFKNDRAGHFSMGSIFNVTPASIFSIIDFGVEPVKIISFLGHRSQRLQCSRSVRSVVVIRSDPSRGGSRRCKNRSRGSPSSRNFFFRLEGYSNKPNTKQWYRSIWEEVLLFFFPFRSQIFDAFLTSFGLRHFALFYAISKDLYPVKCLIYIYFV